MSVILESNLKSAKPRFGLIKFDDNRQTIPIVYSNFVFKPVASKRALKSDIAVAHGFVLMTLNVQKLGCSKEVGRNIIT